MDQQNRVESDSSEVDPVNEPVTVEAVPLKLAAKLARIMARVGGIPKDRKNEQQNYMYRSEDIVMETLRPLLAKSGIAVLVRQTEFENLGTTISGKQGLVRVKVDVDFIDGETGEVLTASAYGVGSDSNDKAIYKAVTGATKYVFFKCFMISEGGDPEEDGEEERKPAAAKKQQTISEAQFIQLKRDGDIAEVQWDKFMSHFAISDLSEMPAAMFQQADAMIQTLRKRKQAAAQPKAQ